MQWVTRDHVHLDRVAAAWLIRRFIDPESEFLFVPSGTELALLPPGATPYGLPHVKLSAHDASGSTFRKTMREYGVATGPLELLADIIEDAIAHFLREKRDGGADIRKLRHLEAIGLIAISEGVMYDGETDIRRIDLSMALYDALYAYCQAQLLTADNPVLRALPPHLALPKLKGQILAPKYR